MNRLENWFCASSFWRRLTRDQLLPWLLEGMNLGDHVLEIGAGAGAATEELRKRAARVTSLEYSRELLAKLAGRNRSDGLGSGKNAAVVQGDAAALPFPEETFSAVMAVLMLHHLRSPEVQDRVIAEAFRVLRPGGAFLAMEIEDTWLNRLLHIRSTFVPVNRSEFPERLRAAGFCDVSIAFRSGALRIKVSKDAKCVSG